MNRRKALVTEAVSAYMGPDVRSELGLDRYVVAEEKDGTFTLHAWHRGKTTLREHNGLQLRHWNEDLTAMKERFALLPTQPDMQTAREAVERVKAKARMLSL